MLRVWQENKGEKFYYSESNAYEATKTESLNDIWLILNNIKGIIEIRAAKQFEKNKALWAITKNGSKKI